MIIILGEHYYDDAINYVDKDSVVAAAADNNNDMCDLLFQMVMEVPRSGSTSMVLARGRPTLTGAWCLASRISQMRLSEPDMATSLQGSPRPA